MLLLKRLVAEASIDLHLAITSHRIPSLHLGNPEAVGRERAVLLLDCLYYLCIINSGSYFQPIADNASISK